MKKLLLILLILFTLTACDLGTKYTVVFDTSGFDKPTDVMVDEGGTLILPEDPMRDGYVFAGWYTDPNYTTAFDTSQVVTIDMTLYGKWLKQYTVTFDSQGGSIVSDMIVIEGEAFTLPENPIFEGYYFGGWFMGPLSTTVFDDTDVVVEDMTVYAKWFENYFSYTITLMDGDTVANTYEAAYGKKTDLPDLEREGYNFRGWYTDEELTNKFTYDGVFTEDTTLYAKWAPVQSFAYFIFQNLLLDRVTLSYGQELDISDMEYHVDGFEFVGWYSDSDYQNEITTVTGGMYRQYIFAKYDYAEENIDLTTLAYYDYLSDSNPAVTITTNVGVMELELFPSVAPNTVNNFINYIQDVDYTGSTFHRVIYEFMIQGGIVNESHCAITGDFESNGVTNNLSHTRGVISMARTSVKDSATSQFFIVQEDSTFLDGEYAAFGGLVSGFNVMDFISIAPKDSNDRPYTDIVIESITVELNGYTVSDTVCAD